MFKYSGSYHGGKCRHQTFESSQKFCWTVLIQMSNFLTKFLKIFVFSQVCFYSPRVTFLSLPRPCSHSEKLTSGDSSCDSSIPGPEPLLECSFGVCAVAYPNVCSAFLRGLGLALIQLSTRDCQRHSRKPSREGKALGKEGLRGFYQ